MVSMCFNLRLNKSISSVECIYPDSFSLRVKGKGVKEIDIEFDFKSYDMRIDDGSTVSCIARNLDTVAYPESVGLFELAEDCFEYMEWAYISIHCGVDSDSGEKIEVLGVDNIVLQKDGKSIPLPEYCIQREDGSVVLAGEKLIAVKGAIKEIVSFCNETLKENEDDIIRFYEYHGRVYIRTTAGEGYFYDVCNNTVVGLGDKSTSNKEVVRGLILDAVENLTRIVDNPINCISVPIIGASGGIQIQSKRESGAYDIILR